MWCGGQGEECQFAPSPLQLPGEVVGGGGRRMSVCSLSSPVTCISNKYKHPLIKITEG